MDRNTGGRYIICDLILPALRDSYEDTAAAAAGADLLVTHPLTFSGFLFARKTGMPWASLALAPVSMYSGIGTTGETMRAGRPMLVVHYSHDQPDHARRLTRLGVARGVPREQYSAAAAARAIKTLLQDGSYAERAADLGARVRSETGAATACDLLSRLLRKSAEEKEIFQQSDRAIA